MGWNITRLGSEEVNIKEKRNIEIWMRFSPNKINIDDSNDIEFLLCNVEGIMGPSDQKML